MTDDWFAASLNEVGHFLDKFEHQKSVTVKADSDLVAALLGVVGGVTMLVDVARGIGSLNEYISLLERPLGQTHQSPQDQ